jgi:hypothetical protein
MNIKASLHTGLVLAGFDQQARQSGRLSASPTRRKADLCWPILVQPGLLGSGSLPFFQILFNLYKFVNLLFDLNGKENAKCMVVARYNFLSVL